MHRRFLRGGVPVTMPASTALGQLVTTEDVLTRLAASPDTTAPENHSYQLTY